MKRSFLALAIVSLLVGLLASPGVSSAGDFVFAYDDGFQPIPSGNVFASVRFNHNAQLDGWDHPVPPPALATTFTAHDTGLYLVTYDLQLTVNGLVGVIDTCSARIIVTHGTIAAEVAGSQSHSTVTVAALSSEHRTVQRSSLVSVSAGDVLEVQVASNEGLLPLANDGITATGAGIVPVGASITIVRIQ